MDPNLDEKNQKSQPEQSGTENRQSTNNPQPTDGTQPPQEEAVFFNVMPKNKNLEKLVEPSVNIIPGAQQPAPEIGFFTKYKRYLIAGAVILVVGAGIYFAFSYFGKNSYKTENIIVNRATPAKNVEEGQNDTLPQEGLTTPLEWRARFFPNCREITICGDVADPDRDGLSNSDEFTQNTDPNNADSDQDGLADGDEIGVFSANPLESHSSKDSKYTDADFLRGGYSIVSGKQMGKEELVALGLKMKAAGLHQPTITTLQNVLLPMYNFSDLPANNSSSTPPTGASSSPLSGIDTSIEAKQDRDAQRSSTIKNIELALVKYYTDNKAYPATSDFMTMYDKIRPYLKIATNPADPINKDPYLYAYTADAAGKDFTLAFFIEVGNQPIKKHAADAQKDSQNEQAAIYDDQRKNDLENLRSALLLYSNNNIAGNQEYVFPSMDKYKTSLVPEYVSVLPKDPKTGQDYLYQVAETFNTFTLKSVLDNPPVGMSGYLCNQEDCHTY